MDQIQLMFSVCGRNDMNSFYGLFSECKVNPMYVSLGYGTAGRDVIDRFGLQNDEKAVMLSAVTEKTWRTIKNEMQNRLSIGLPGRGIAFTVPMSGIGGMRQLRFLLGEQTFEKGDESTLKNTEQELIVVISNIGYSDPIMDSARSAGAGGGTVIHAKGTGQSGAEKFLGVTLAKEKEIILIVALSSMKKDIMTAIMENNGIPTPAQAVVFSLPVTDTAGINFPVTATED